ncbi:MAG: DedA family protein [Bacteroidetes bacterium]|jgi:membrane-associated protein|nr:DedA family protein [Bacteroidota bacterium]
MIKELLDFILHINDHLTSMVQEYGTLVYAILFLIIFVETGLVIMPFLPGDSLLFAAGALCANEATGLNIVYLIALLFVAAVLGDNTNYWIGRTLGLRVTTMTIGKRRIVKQDYLDKTHAFFEKYGTKAIIMARFVPIVRTFTPFVAGVGKMTYRTKFLPYDVAGGFLWIASMSLAGYFLGTHEWVKKHFEGVVIAIIIISVMPMLIAYLRHRFSKK